LWNLQAEGNNLKDQPNPGAQHRRSEMPHAGSQHPKNSVGTVRNQMHQMTDKTKTGGKAQGVGHIGTLLMIDIVFLFAHAALECASKPLHFEKK